MSQGIVIFAHNNTEIDYGSVAIANATMIKHHMGVDAITLINSFEINYKNVKNKRVHIELGLMQLASLHFDGEKKKVS